MRKLDRKRQWKGKRPNYTFSGQFNIGYTDVYILLLFAAFWAISGDDRALLQAICSGITPGGTLVTMWDTWD